MSKSNVHPGQYKVAGRERQGEDIAHIRNKQRLAESLIRSRFERDTRAPQAEPAQEPAKPRASRPEPTSPRRPRKKAPAVTAKTKRVAKTRATAKRAPAKRAPAKRATPKRTPAKRVTKKTRR